MLRRTLGSCATALKVKLLKLPRSALVGHVEVCVEDIKVTETYSYVVRDKGGPCLLGSHLTNWLAHSVMKTLSTI